MHESRSVGPRQHTSAPTEQNTPVFPQRMPGSAPVSRPPPSLRPVSTTFESGTADESSPELVPESVTTDPSGRIVPPKSSLFAAPPQAAPFAASAIPRD